MVEVTSHHWGNVTTTSFPGFLPTPPIFSHSVGMDIEENPLGTRLMSTKKSRSKLPKFLFEVPNVQQHCLKNRNILSFLKI